MKNHGLFWVAFVFFSSGVLASVDPVASIEGGESCSEWKPSVEKLPADKWFNQKRTCIRPSAPKYRHHGLSNTHSKYEEFISHRNVRGGDDHVVATERESSWGKWEPKVAHPNTCRVAEKLRYEIDEGERFIALTTCQGVEQRKLKARDRWLSGKLSERVDLTQHEERSATIYFSTIMNGLKERWSDSGSLMGPDVLVDSYCNIPSYEILLSVNAGEWIVWPAICERTYKSTLYDVKTSSLGTTKKEVKSESRRRVAEISFIPQPGMKDYIVSHDWVDHGSTVRVLSECFFAPEIDVSNIDYPNEIVQSYLCAEERTTNKNKVRTYASGRVDVTDNTTQKELSSVYYFRTEFGQKDKLISHQDVHGPWVASGDDVCSGWSPNANMMPLSQAFHQERTCEMRYERSIERVESWVTGEKVIALPNESNAIINTEHRMGFGDLFFKRMAYHQKISDGPVKWSMDAPPFWSKTLRIEIELLRPLERLEFHNGRSVVEFTQLKEGKNSIFIALSDENSKTPLTWTLADEPGGSVASVSFYFEQ